MGPGNLLRHLKALITIGLEDSVLHSGVLRPSGLELASVLSAPVPFVSSSIILLYS